MHKSYFKYILILTISILIYSCQEDNIVITKLCTEEPTFAFKKARMLLVSEINSESIIYIYPNGRVSGENIKLRQYGISNTFSVEGYICKDKKLFLNVFCVDTTVTSKLKLEGEQIGQYSISGKLYYCQNLNNQCHFEEIGHFSGGFTILFEGSYTSPLFSGYFQIFPIYE
jgi:hypothetical protein